MNEHLAKSLKLGEQNVLFYTVFVLFFIFIFLFFLFMAVISYITPKTYLKSVSHLNFIL